MRIKRIKRVLLLIILLITISSSIYASSYIFNQVDTTNEKNSLYESNISNSYTNKSKYDYFLEDYDINMIVNEDNTFDITERITAYFNVPKHRNI